MSSQLHFIRPYLRGWIIIVGSMALAYIVASKYLSYVTPIYESTTKLRLADHNEGIPNSNLFKDLDVFVNTQKIQTEIELITSDAILGKALQNVPFSTIISRVGKLKNTELFLDSPIEINFIKTDKQAYNRSFLLSIKADSTLTLTAANGKSVRGTFKDTLNIANDKIIISLNQPLLKEKNIKWVDKYQISVLSEESLLNQIRGNLDVTSVDKDVPIIRISYKSPNPEKAALLPNAIAQAYIEDYIETKYGAANVTAGFLDGRIKEISGKLSQAESEILDYRKQNRITSLVDEKETDLRKVSQLKIQQINLRMNLDAIRELENYIQKGQNNFLDLAPNFEAFSDMLSTEIVKKIKQLQSEKKDLLLVYTPKEDKVRLIDDKIKDLTSYLTESISNTRKNLEIKYNNLVADIDKAEQSFKDVPEKERVMTILDREFDIYQQSYNFLNQKQIEAEIAKAAKVAFHRVITPASVSKSPVSPNKAIIKGVSVILGMIGAILLIFIVHSLKARINDVSAIESNSTIPVVAKIPKLKTPLQAEQHFLRLLTQWQVKGLLDTKGIMCFTGFDAKEGQLFIANQISNVLKIQGKKLLIVSLNHDAIKSNFYETAIIDSLETHLYLNTNNLNRYPITTIQNVIKEESINYDHCVLINSSLNDNYTLGLMQTAVLNLICVDARLTSAKSIIEIDLLQHEYKLPALYFMLNRDGYNPKLVTEIFSNMKKAVKAVKKSKVV